MKSFYKEENMKKILIFIYFAASMAGLVSCAEKNRMPSEPASMSIYAAPEDGAGMTRSVLEETPAFEDLVTCVTVAAFDNATGRLVGTFYRHSGQFDISLPMDRTYRIFLLANMGDCTGRIPYGMADMENFRYDVASYQRLKKMGLPMVWTEVTPWAPKLTLPLRRLMAKLVIRVDKTDIAGMGGGGEESFRNRMVEVHRVARALYPFADEGSAAKGKADLFDDGEIEYDIFSDMTAVRSEELVMYVPENMQGTKRTGISRPGDKSESNPYLTGTELCTYVSLEGYKDGSADGVYGNLVYRFFPGSDNVSNFDLMGGKRYDLTLKLTWNGMYTAGDWQVERRDWRDRRKVFVSLGADGGYVSELSVSLARGSTGVPVYICYSPQGKEYGNGEACHYTGGWMFGPESSLDSPASVSYVPAKNNKGEFLGRLMSTGFVEHREYHTVHYVTVPMTTEAGYENSINYLTLDRRKKAVLNVKVAEPSINLSPESMLFLFHEYGYDSRRTIRMDPSSTVRTCNVSVDTDDDELITIGPFDPEAGKVDVYWNDTNTTSSPKTAGVCFRSEACGVIAVCTLVQQSRPALSVDDEMAGGSADIEY